MFPKYVCLIFDNTIKYTKILRSTHPKTPKPGSLLVIILSCPPIGSLSSSTANPRAAENNYRALGCQDLYYLKLCKFRCDSQKDYCHIVTGLRKKQQKGLAECTKRGGLRKESRANDDPRIVLLEQCVQKWNLQIELWCFFTFCNANANFALAHRLGNLSGAREKRTLLWILVRPSLAILSTLKKANSSLTDHYNASELVQYLNFKLGILTTLTANQK